MGTDDDADRWVEEVFYHYTAHHNYSPAINSGCMLSNKVMDTNVIPSISRPYVHSDDKHHCPLLSYCDSIESQFNCFDESYLSIQWMDWIWNGVAIFVFITIIYFLPSSSSSIQPIERCSVLSQILAPPCLNSFFADWGLSFISGNKMFGSVNKVSSSDKDTDESFRLRWFLLHELGKKSQS